MNCCPPSPSPPLLSPLFPSHFQFSYPLPSPSFSYLFPSPGRTSVVVPVVCCVYCQCRTQCGWDLSMATLWFTMLGASSPLFSSGHMVRAVVVWEGLVFCTSACTYMFMHEHVHELDIRVFIYCLLFFPPFPPPLLPGRCQSVQCMAYIPNLQTVYLGFQNGIVWAVPENVVAMETVGMVTRSLPTPKVIFHVSYLLTMDNLCVVSIAYSSVHDLFT